MMPRGDLWPAAYPTGMRSGRMDAARPGLRKQNPVSDRPTRSSEQRGLTPIMPVSKRTREIAGSP